MKLQCPCGAKYAFDIRPEMMQNPVRFVCPQCGQDSSDFVNALVRREFGNVPLPPPSATLPDISGTTATPPPAPVQMAPSATPRLRVTLSETPATPVEVAAVNAPMCALHHGVPATDRCVFCLKPTCPQCRERFGNFCSMTCKNQAARARSEAKSDGEAKFWRKTGLAFGSGFAVIALAIGGWAWYAFFGSMPHPVFSVRFDQKSHSGASQLVGMDQFVYLHGGTLGRADLKTKKAVWSIDLVTPAQVAAAVKRANEAPQSGMVITATRLEKMVRLELEEALSLRVAGQNIWVGNGDKLTHYDWDSGRELSEVTVPESGGELVQAGDELQLRGQEFVTHISLADGGTRTEEFRDPRALALAGTQNPHPASGKTATGGLPIGGGNNGKPLDPAKVAAQAQNLKLPAKIALPALLANAQHEQQLEAALRDDLLHGRAHGGERLADGAVSFRLVPGPNGVVQFSEKMIEEHFVTRTAMKAAPKKSALDGEVNATKTGEIANEILNEMQRNSGGDSVTEDDSRYQATVYLPGTAASSDWTGEVVGPPQLFPMKTVNVVAGGKSVIVLDQSNKKMWQAALTYPLSDGSGEGESQYGAGPCVERGDILYVFDQAVLAAFDLTTGNARWRLPSVGVVGLFFDAQGMVYVNTTTGNPDDIKYAKQIDINKSTAAVLLKIDPKTGKTLWTIKPGGFVSYLSGKFIYTMQSYDPGDKEDELSDTMDMLQKPAFMHIARLDPKNGRTLWDYQDNQAPVHVQFHENSIELVFKKEVQVLRYLSF